MTKVDEILANVRDLPPLPDTVLKLLNVVNDQESTVADIVEAIRYDQVVTAEVLRVCSSAWLGAPRGINTLHDAMRFLGTARVLNLVLAMHGNGLLSPAQQGYGLEPGALWRHSVGVALASAAFAERIKPSTRNLCFTAGLLHDIGKVVLNEFIATELEQVLAVVESEHLSFIEAEKRVLGCSHADIGERVALRWKLPELIVRCIRYHHEPQELDPPDPMVDAVHLANCVCLLCGVGMGDDGLCYRAEAGVMERHGLTESDLEMIGAQMLTDLRGVELAFGKSPIAAKPAGRTSHRSIKCPRTS